MKFLVRWELEIIDQRTVAAVMEMPDHAECVREQDKLVDRYHVVGKHGGAWPSDVDSDEELERLLAMAPVSNVARYRVFALAEMETPADVPRPPEGI